MSTGTGIVYLLAAVTFIFGIRQLGSPVTARRGNRLAAVGMLAALIATVVDHTLLNYWLIGLGVLIGAVLGTGSALRVKMTAMPQMVAIFNGMGGGAAALVSTLEFVHLTPTLHLAAADKSSTIVLSAAIGAVSFGGSMIAFGKLQEILPGSAMRYPLQQVVNVALVLGIVAAALYVSAGAPNRAVFAVLLTLAVIFGVLLVIPIGGADMPVVISLMNSLTGIATALTGFVLNNELLIVAGALVGASGTLLTILMGKAMNRPLTNVLFGAFGMQATATSVAGIPEGASIREISPEDAALVMEYAQQVVIVPGYGLAVAQAQHQARELGDLLGKAGVNVKYAIHPVAGRMPGHMNVLLAEANVPYSQLYEMDAINGDFPHTDVALVVGANDVTNPAARTDPGSPIYGMPILEVDKAAHVIVLKRSMRPGFAGVDNPLYYDPKTTMLFGDAKDSLSRLVAAVKAATPGSPASVA